MKGWSAVEQFEEEKEARDAQFQAQSKPMLFVSQKNPGPVAIRFLEQGETVSTYYTHDYKIPSAGGVSTRRFTCLSQPPWNQECPGCKAGLKRKTRGVFNVIQRGRAVLRRGADGKALKGADGNWIIDGYRDEVVIASVGGPTASMLRKADGQYHGLMSRDFVVQYSGDTFQAWNMTPAIDAQGNAMATPMSDADQQLAAAKHDLDEFMKPPTAQEAAQIVARYGGNSGASQPLAQPGQPQQPGAPVNQFLQGAPLAPGTNALGMATGATQPPQQPAPAPAPAQQG